jgi:hypothetical protein
MFAARLLSTANSAKHKRNVRRGKQAFWSRDQASTLGVMMAVVVYLLSTTNTIQFHGLLDACPEDLAKIDLQIFLWFMIDRKLEMDV